MELELFVTRADTSERVPVVIRPANRSDFAQTRQAGWQTNWNSRSARSFPNKVAMETTSGHELLGLMSYSCDDQFLAVEIIYMESQPQSNGNLLHQSGLPRAYIGIARAFFAYAAAESVRHGYDGVLLFKAKTDTLLEYYIHEFGARPVSRYDPFRLVLWENAAQKILSEYEVNDNE